MSILVSGIRLAFDAPEQQAVQAALRQCGVSAGDVRAAVYRKSLDARHGKISRVYSVKIDGIKGAEAFAEKLQMPSVRFYEPKESAPAFGKKKLPARPVIIGMGPAGLFAAYTLARYGYQPVVFEQGACIEERDSKVNAFFSGGALDESTNIQFGEGGAGTYSDGKLTTRINDPICETVLQTLHVHGAPDEILQQAKPHIGTDVLKNVVRAMRGQIIKNGGEVHFNTKLTGLQTQGGRLVSVTAGGQEIAASHAVLATGHSARDTFEMLLGSGVYIEPKAFSVGARIEHLQHEIDKMFYGKFAGHAALPPAEYTLSHRREDRACYSFCMCPGGHVVAAQSEKNSIVTNGMSYHARDGRNANAAIVVSVNPADFGGSSPLAGVLFQREIEQAAYRYTGGYAAPCQTVKDFLADRPSANAAGVQPTYPLGVQYGDIRAFMPEFVTDMMKEGLRRFGQRVKGFDGPDALLTAPETRTSSPVRMTRGKDLYSLTAAGLIPCGEGAGYAGGIMSAAVDGIRAAYRIMEEYAPLL